MSRKNQLSNHHAHESTSEVRAVNLSRVSVENEERIADVTRKRGAGPIGRLSLKLAEGRASRFTEKHMDDLHELALQEDKERVGEAERKNVFAELGIQGEGSERILENYSTEEILLAVEAMKLHGEYMADNENRLEELKRQYGGDPRDAYWDYHTEAEQYAAAQLGLSSEEVFKAANALSDAGFRG